MSLAPLPSAVNASASRFFALSTVACMDAAHTKSRLDAASARAASVLSNSALNSSRDGKSTRFATNLSSSFCSLVQLSYCLLDTAPSRSFSTSAIMESSSARVIGLICSITSFNTSTFFSSKAARLKSFADTALSRLSRSLLCKRSTSWKFISPYGSLSLLTCSTA